MVNKNMLVRIALVLLAALGIAATSVLNIAKAEGRGSETGVWEITDLQNCMLELVEPMPEANLRKVIAALNKRHSTPGLRLRGVTGHTANVDVLDDAALTEQMGSTGSKEFLVAATYSITSVRGVHAVHLFFEEGSHARPGLFNRGTIQLPLGCKVLRRPNVTG